MLKPRPTRWQAAMAKDQADSVQWHTLTQHFRGSGVTEKVSAFRGGAHAGLFQRALDHARHAVVGHERLERRDLAKKDVICCTEIGPGDQIPQQSVASILRQRQADFVTPFPHNPEREIGRAHV